MKRLMVIAQTLIAAAAVMHHPANAQSTPRRQTCDIKYVQDAWVKDRKHGAIKNLRDALKTANKEILEYPLKDFGYNEESQRKNQKAAKDLLKEQQTAFDTLIKQIAVQRTRVCAVCRLRGAYEVAKEGGIDDVTEAELLASELGVMFRDLASFAEQIAARREALEKESNPIERRRLEKEIEGIEARSRDAKQTLHDYRQRNPAGKAIKTEMESYICR